MGMPIEAGREFWRGLLRAGGATTVPRWTLDPVPGVAEHVATMPDVLVSGMIRLAGRHGMSFSTLVLAAHAKVLAVLSGERDVVIGLASGRGGRPLPCRLTTTAPSWRKLVCDAARAESGVLRHSTFPVDVLRRELGVAAPSFETVFNAYSADSADSGGVDSAAGVDRNAVLEVGLTIRSGQLAVRLRYRTDALDAGSAERIAGYHLTALALMVADPDGEHEWQTLSTAP
jgi:non-ribosomal peptide synthetase component F